MVLVVEVVDVVVELVVDIVASLFLSFKIIPTIIPTIIKHINNPNASKIFCNSHELHLLSRFGSVWFTTDASVSLTVKDLTPSFAVPPVEDAFKLLYLIWSLTPISSNNRFSSSFWIWNGRFLTSHAIELGTHVNQVGQNNTDTTMTKNISIWVEFDHNEFFVKFICIFKLFFAILWLFVGCS